jgi:hypothetical protein
MMVIVIRAAYCDAPDKVIAFDYCESRTDVLEAIIAEHYPGATNIRTGDFDHESNPAGYIFDVTRVIGA